MKTGEIPASTASVTVPKALLDQVIGQDRAVEIVRLAAMQRRFLLIAGEPGTGKSLLGQAVAEMLSADNLQDVLGCPNRQDPKLPLIRVLPTGEGQKAIEQARRESKKAHTSSMYLLWIAGLASLFLGIFFALKDTNFIYGLGGAVVFWLIMAAGKFFLRQSAKDIPKLLIANKHHERAPFIDATGNREGALLGDVRHDPYQSGGVETAPHQLIEAGAIHRAHRGVLYIDEVSTLSIESQQSLLTAIQEKELPILGRSQGSSGTLVRTDPVPCDFLLILAGNNADIQNMHPALRSRIRGYGYEICTQTTMEDTPENRSRLVQFIAQEIKRDGKIPHFSAAAIREIIADAQRLAGIEGKLSTRFRELGGLIRIAGDLAVQGQAELVETEHVEKARGYAVSFEAQQAQVR